MSLGLWCTKPFSFCDSLTYSCYLQIEIRNYQNINKQNMEHFADFNTQFHNNRAWKPEKLGLKDSAESLYTKAYTICSIS